MNNFFLILLSNFLGSLHQTLDPVQKTLRLVLDSTTGGPGVQKKKALVISLGDIEALT